MSRFRRIGLGVVDQGLSSVSNVLFLIAVARVAGVEEFGAVSFAYALFAFGLGVQRVSLGTLISLSVERRIPPPLVLSLAWAGVVAALGVVLGQVVDVRGSTAFHVLLVGAFVAYPQDLLRYEVIARKRAGAAAVSDGLWVAVTAVLLLLDVAGTRLSVAQMVTAWVVLGAGGALAVILPAGSASLGLPRTWWHEHAREMVVLGPDALLACLAPLVLASVMGHFMTLGDVAAVRGAGTLLGPASMLFSALPVVLLPEMARVLGEDRFKLASAQAGVMSVIVLVWGGLLFTVPAAVGQQVLGATWNGSRAILWWSTLELLMWALASGPISVLGTYRRWRTLFVVRLVYLFTVGVVLAATVTSGDLERVMIGMVLAGGTNFLVLATAARRERPVRA